MDQIYNLKPFVLIGYYAFVSFLILFIILENKKPEKYRMVFLLKTVQNYETAEICNELGISSSNLWVIIHRARVQLRRCVEENWFKN